MGFITSSNIVSQDLPNRPLGALADPGRAVTLHINASKIAAMRIIYTDEAGTTAPEPVSVVAALIVNPDVHWFPVTRRVRELWDHHIPSEYRHENPHTLHKDFRFLCLHSTHMFRGNQLQSYVKS